MSARRISQREARRLRKRVKALEDERYRQRFTWASEYCAERLNKTERAATPPAFRDLLLSIARSASVRETRTHRKDQQC